MNTKKCNNIWQGSFVKKKTSDKFYVRGDFHSLLKEWKSPLRCKRISEFICMLSIMLLITVAEIKFHSSNNVIFRVLTPLDGGCVPMTAFQGSLNSSELS